MPKRRFADDDPESDEDQQYRGGGKQLRMMGKQLQRPPESEDDSDEDESEEPVYNRGGGKQLRPGGGKQFRMGKQLRVADHGSDDDDDDDDEEEDDAMPVQPVSRGGGKSLSGMQPPPDDDDDEEDDDDDDDDEDEPAPVRVVQRGGKSLIRMRPAEEEEEEDDDDDDDDDEELEDEDDDDEPVQVQPVQRGGKSLARMQPRGGGKQLRPPQPQEESDEEESADNEEPQAVVARAPHGGGKQLRRPPPVKSDSDDDDDDEDMEIDEDSEDEVVKKPAPRQSYGRGKTLRRPASAEEEDDKPPPKKVAPAAKEAEVEDMEESDDESSDEERELDMETLDPQTLVQGEEDQKHLDSLPEFEREAILGERFEKLKNAADMKKALRESKRKEREEKEAKKKSAKKKPSKGRTPAKKSAKKPSNDTDGDAALAAKLATSRESTRNRDAAGTKAKKSAALAQLREERKTLIQQKDEEESDLDFGSTGDEDESDDDYEDSKQVVKPWQKNRGAKPSSSRLDALEASDEEVNDVSAPDQAPAVEAELEDYIKVTLPRRRLARWCNEPFFDEAVMGCFVRLFIGEDGDGKKCYRLCEIVGVEKSKTEYKFPVTSVREKPISSNKALKLKFGKNERNFPMYLVSDSRPTDEDVKKYVSVQKASRQEALGKREATRLRRKQDDLVNNYTYTQADINRTIAERKKTGKSTANLGSEQTRVAIAVQAAISAVDDAKRRLEDAKKAHLEGGEDESDDLKAAVEDADEALKEAKQNLEEKRDEEQRILSVVESRKKKLSKRRKDQNWAKVNERAAKMNQNADFESYKDQLAKKDAEAKSGSQPSFNPYARRKVKPKILWEVGQKEEKKDDDATKTVDNETREDAADTSKAVNGRDDQAVNDPLQEDVLVSQKASLMGERHQFSIDEEALAPNTASLLGTNRSKQKETRVRKGLSLAQYQERKTAGTL